MAGMKYRLRRSTGRAQFEADKLARANRLRSEAEQVRRQIERYIELLGKKAFELVIEGETLNPKLDEITTRIRALQADLERKYDQIRAIHAEAWVPPSPRPRKSSLSEPGATGNSVSQRLQSYIQDVQTLRVCPDCRTPVHPPATVCPDCGYRLKPLDATSYTSR